MRADPSYGETPGGLQGPHFVLIDGVYHVFYGAWNHICLARSDGGNRIDRWAYPDGRTGMLGEGDDANARDAMVLAVGRVGAV